MQKEEEKKEQQIQRPLSLAHSLTHSFIHSLAHSAEPCAPLPRLESRATTKPTNHVFTILLPLPAPAGYTTRSTALSLFSFLPFSHTLVNKRAKKRKHRPGAYICAHTYYIFTNAGGHSARAGFLLLGLSTRVCLSLSLFFSLSLASTTEPGVCSLRSLVRCVRDTHTRILRALLSFYHHYYLFVYVFLPPSLSLSLPSLGRESEELVERSSAPASMPSSAR